VRTATCAGARVGRVEALASGGGGMQIAPGTCSGCITGKPEALTKKAKRSRSRLGGSFPRQATRNALLVSYFRPVGNSSTFGPNYLPSASQSSFLHVFALFVASPQNPLHKKYAPRRCANTAHTSQPFAPYISIRGVSVQTNLISVLFLSQCHHRVHLHCSSGRNKSSQ